LQKPFYDISIGTHTPSIFWAVLILKKAIAMRFFSIYEPISGPLHYYTITLIGFQHGFVIRWTQQTDQWCPKVVRLKKLTSFNGSKLVGYQLTPPEDIDTYALEAMTGEKRSWP